MTVKDVDNKKAIKIKSKTVIHSKKDRLEVNKIRYHVYSDLETI